MILMPKVQITILEDTETDKKYAFIPRQQLKRLWDMETNKAKKIKGLALIIDKGRAKFQGTFPDDIGH